MSKYYPPISEKDIRLIQKLYEGDPSYFEAEECPYSPEVKDLFKGEVQSKYFDDTNPVKPIASDDEIAQEINDVYAKLKEYWEEVKSSDKSADKNTFFRVSTSLLDKLVELRERMSKIKKVNAFITEVLAIMDEILLPDQRNEVTERLAKFSQETK